MDRSAYRSLMNENTESKKFEDDQIGKVVDLEPKESSVDQEKMLFQTPPVIPFELATQESQNEPEVDVSFDDIADVILGLFDLGQPSEEELYASIEVGDETEMAVATNCDIHSESSSDSQASSPYPGQAPNTPEQSVKQPFNLPGFSGAFPESVHSPSEDLNNAMSDFDLGNTKKGVKRLSEKGTPEYKDKRARNNVAVRRCRTKAKIRQRENESRVKELITGNELLRKTVAQQSTQIDTLKNLLLESGVPLPPNFDSDMQS